MTWGDWVVGGGLVTSGVFFFKGMQIIAQKDAGPWGIMGLFVGSYAIFTAIAKIAQFDPAYAQYAIEEATRNALQKAQSQQAQKIRTTSVELFLEHLETHTPDVYAAYMLITRGAVPEQFVQQAAQQFV